MKTKSILRNNKLKLLASIIEHIPYYKQNNYEYPILQKYGDQFLSVAEKPFMQITKNVLEIGKYVVLITLMECFK